MTLAKISIVRTIFVLLIFSLGTMMFIHDINSLVLNPLEKMMNLVNKIARDPLCAKD